MNKKYSKEEYELLFSKLGSNGRSLSNAEIARILKVSKSTVGDAKRKWLDKKSTAEKDKEEQSEVIEREETKNDTHKMLVSLDILRYLATQTYKSENENTTSKNLFENYYYKIGKSLFKNYLDRNKLKLEIDTKEKSNEDISILEKELAHIELKIELELEVLTRTVGFVFPQKLVFKNKAI